MFSEYSTSPSNPLTINSIFDQKTTQNNETLTGNFLEISIETDWEEHQDPLGRFYYVNKKSKQSTYEKQVTKKPIATVVPEEWEEHKDPLGRNYYVNYTKKISSYQIANISI